MHIYRCHLTLHEATFFSSREVSATYQTEPVLGNIALAYAFGFCQSAYFNDGTIHYKTHLSELNERGLYVTPGTITGKPRFTLGQFNAQPDAYWYAMGAGTIVTRPDGGFVTGSGKTWRVGMPGKKPKKVQAETRPQFGRIRMLAIANEAVCYILSEEAVTIPAYIRLGKFMSKARVDVKKLTFDTVSREQVTVPMLLNPADLPTPPLLFDLVNIPPTPLIRNAQLDGDFYRLGDKPKNKTLLPIGMQFNVEALS